MTKRLPKVLIFPPISKNSKPTMAANFSPIIHAIKSTPPQPTKQIPSNRLTRATPKALLPKNSTQNWNN